MEGDSAEKPYFSKRKKKKRSYITTKQSNYLSVNVFPSVCFLIMKLPSDKYKATLEVLQEQALSQLLKLLDCKKR